MFGSEHKPSLQQLRFPLWPLSEPDRSASYGVIGIKGGTDYPLHK